jgi:hypothetical protein
VLLKFGLVHLAGFALDALGQHGDFGIAQDAGLVELLETFEVGSANL